MHVAPGAHWVMRGLLLQSALDGSAGGSESEAPPSHNSAPTPAMVPPQAARVLDDDRLRMCQVPGCDSAPLAARSYLGRCRLCVPHMRADEVHLGGELGPDAGLGRKPRGLKVSAAELPDYVERVLGRFDEQKDDDESFASWARRADEEALA
jgi:hypothetical protein